MPGSKQTFALTIEQRFQRLSGRLQTGSDEIALKTLTATGDRLTATADVLSGGRVHPWRFSGRLREHSLEGTVQEGNGLNGKKQAWRATRNPSSMTLLEE